MCIVTAISHSSRILYKETYGLLMILRIKNNSRELLSQIKTRQWTELVCKIPDCPLDETPIDTFATGLYSSNELARIRRAHIKEYHNKGGSN